MEQAIKLLLGWELRIGAAILARAHSQRAYNSRGESITVVFLNGHDGKLPPKYSWLCSEINTILSLQHSIFFCSRQLLIYITHKWLKCGEEVSVSAQNEMRQVCYHLNPRQGSENITEKEVGKCERQRLGRVPQTAFCTRRNFSTHELSAAAVVCRWAMSHACQASTERLRAVKRCRGKGTVFFTGLASDKLSFFL